MATRIGPRMAEVVSFVRANPGSCKAEVRRALALYPNPWGGHDTIERAINRGHIAALKVSSGRVFLFAPESDIRPADCWAPGHP